MLDKNRSKNGNVLLNLMLTDEDILLKPFQNKIDGSEDLHDT